MLLLECATENLYFSSFLNMLYFVVVLLIFIIKKGAAISKRECGRKLKTKLILR